MSKINRFDGDYKAFASEQQTNERTTFGTETISDDLTAQQTPEYLRGMGIVGPSQFPTLQDFNAVNYSVSQTLSYMHQMGIPEWSAEQEYPTEGATCLHNGVQWYRKSTWTLGDEPGNSASWSLSSVGDEIILSSETLALLIDRCTYLVDNKLIQDGALVKTKWNNSISFAGSATYELITSSEALSRGLSVDSEIVAGNVIGVNHYCGTGNSHVLVMQYEKQIKFTAAGGITGDVSDNAAQSNAALVANISNIHNKQMLLTGIFEISRLPEVLTNKLKCAGLLGLGKECGFKVRGTDYQTNSSPFVVASAGIEFNSMSIDQNWKYLVTAGPAGENVDDFAQNWGGFWLIESLTSESEVILNDVHFNNVMRGVLTNANYITCKNITAYTVETATQCLVAGDSAKQYFLENININGPRWSTTSYVGGFPVVGGSAFFGRDVTDLKIDSYESIGHQLVIQGVTENGAQRDGIVRGLDIKEPRADTSFRNFRELSITAFNIQDSLDMGLTTEGCTTVNISDGVIDRTAVGSLALNGSDTVNVSNVICKDWGQSNIEANLFNRYGSGGGPWLSAVSISFKAGADAAIDVALNNLTARFDNLPPIYDGNPNAPTVTVSGDGSGAEIVAVTKDGIIDSVVIVDGGSSYTTATLNVVPGAVGGSGGSLTAVITGGVITDVTIDNQGGGYGDNSVRKAAFGTFVEPTLGDNSTVRMNNVRMPDLRGSGMPNVFNIMSDYRMGSSSISASPAPISGERFTDASGNTFVYISSQSGTVFLKSLVGDVNVGASFTGETGATIVAGSPDTNLIWLGSINVGNIDFTSTRPDGL